MIIKYIGFCNVSKNKAIWNIREAYFSDVLLFVILAFPVYSMVIAANSGLVLVSGSNHRARVICHLKRLEEDE